MLCIYGKSNKQRRKEDNLKEERTPECCFRCPAFETRGHNKKDGEQEVVETHGGKAAQFLQHQFLEQGQKG
jgi:hypothetical protein